MARDIVAPKSFRTIVGSLDQGGGAPLGAWLLDTNDSHRFYGFFVFFNGEPEKAVFATEYLKKKFSMYSDVFQRGDLSKPQAFMRETLAETLREMDSAGLGAQDTDSFAAILVKEGIVVIGRLNSSPVYFLRDRKFRQIFLPGKTGGQKLEVEAYLLADHDRILMCTANVTNRLTKLELRNILATESDLDLACSKTATLAGRYEELIDPKMALIEFKRHHEVNKALLNKRNVAVFLGVAIFIMTLIFWRELGDFAGKLSFAWPSRQSILSRNGDNQDIQKKSLYQIEQVYDGLNVPYDLAVDPNGALYIVDDKEQQVIRYDPANQRVSLVGNGLQLGFPTGIDIAGDKLYVTDFAGKSSMLYIMQTDGQVLSRIQSIPDASAGQLRKPKAVAVDDSGQVWVADRSNNRLVQFDLLGKYIRAINLQNQFKSPNGLAFGPAPQRDIFVTLKDTNQLIRVARDGRQQKVEIHTGDRTPVEFSQPAGVAVDSNGFMYIADRENSRIVVADPIGKVTAILDKSKFGDFDAYSPFGLKISPDQKYLYIAGSTHASFDDICTAGKCNGKIWRMRIGG